MFIKIIVGIALALVALGVFYASKTDGGDADGGLGYAVLAVYLWAGAAISLLVAGSTALFQWLF